MSFPKYPKYKDSRVEWLGEVPERWDVLPVRAVTDHIDLRNEGATCEDYLSLMANVGVIPYADKGDIGNKKPEDLSKCKLVDVGDIVINSMNYGIGSYGMSSYKGVCSPVYVIMRANEETTLRPFAFRIFQNTAFQKYAASFGNGILAHRAAIGWEELKVIPVAVPSISEQEVILDFLDEESTKIDALIEEQRRLIELLKEKRQSVISHAVAYGLNGALFPLLELGRALIRIDQGWSPQAEDRLPDEHEYGVLRLSAVKRGEFYAAEVKSLGACTDIPLQLLLRKGDLLITRANTPELVGDSCYVTEDCRQVIFSDLIYRLTLNPVMWNYEFVNFALQSSIGRSQARRDARGSSMSMAKLSHSHIKRWTLPAPSIEVQGQIVERIRYELSLISSLQNNALTGIGLLRERRSALISAAVTGKIDVRNYKPQPSAVAEEMYEPA